MPGSVQLLMDGQNGEPSGDEHELHSDHEMHPESVTAAAEEYKFSEDDCKIFKAAAGGDVKFLKTRESKVVGEFRTPSKNTIVHVYIIGQSKGKDESSSALHRLMVKCKKVFLGRRECSEDKAIKTLESMLDLWPPLLWKANKGGDTPLHMAARHGHAHMVKLLIDRCKAEEEDIERGGSGGVREMIQMVNCSKETALHEAVRYQHMKVVELLIAEDDHDFKHSPNEDGETPFYMAAERGNEDLVEMILKHYTCPAYQGPEGRTALHAAALHCPIACITIPLKEELKFLATKVDKLGRTPLHYSTLGLLQLDKSAAFIADNEGMTPVLNYASKGCDWMVSEMADECPQCFEVVDRRGRNALHHAVESGDEATVKVILRHPYLGDLTKKKDKDGMTPLHLLAASRFYMPKLINDPRLDKMAFNSNKLTPNDIIFADPNHSRTEMQLEESMTKAGINQGKRVLIHSESKINFEYQSMDTRKLTKPTNDGDDDHLKEERQNHLVVAALIATVTFAAGFTLPGGYIQEDGPEIGHAVLTKKKSFQAFVISNTLAMVLSCAAVFIHLLIAMNKKKIINTTEANKEKPKRGKEKTIAKIEKKVAVLDLFNKALPITLVAIVAMVIAFITGTYAVLSHSPLLAAAASVTGCLFFGLLWYLWKELLRETLNALMWMLFVAVAPILILVICLWLFGHFVLKPCLDKVGGLVSKLKLCFWFSTVAPTLNALLPPPRPKLSADSSHQGELSLIV